MKKILIVEDNELNMKLFYDILTYSKYDVKKAYCAQEAYDSLKTNSFDLIILDIMLPDYSGFELLEKLQKNNVEIPEIIAVSACAMDEDKEKAATFGIKTYITKPIDIKNFINEVNKSIN